RDVGDALADRLYARGQRGVVEPRRVPAVAAVLEPERAVVHAQLVRDELLAALLVARDHAGHGLRAGVAVPDRQGHEVADPQPLSPRLVRELEFDGPHR